MRSVFLTRALAMLLVAFAFGPALLTPTMTLSQESDDQTADPERGWVVYRSIGYCVNCHGWAGDGRAGVRLQAPAAPDLRETEMDTTALHETIACGRPGTPMPYHDRAAYRDGRCFGMALDDFAPGTAPARGKTFSDSDIANVVAYLQAYVIGRGEPTFEDCTTFYGNPSAAACRGLR